MAPKNKAKAAPKAEPKADPTPAEMKASIQRMLNLLKYKADPKRDKSGEHLTEAQQVLEAGLHFPINMHYIFGSCMCQAYRLIADSDRKGFIAGYQKNGLKDLKWMGTKKVVKEDAEEDLSIKGMMTSTLRCYFSLVLLFFNALLFNAAEVPNFRAQWPQDERLSREEAEGFAGGSPPGVRGFLGPREEHGEAQAARALQVLLQDFGGKQRCIPIDRVRHLRNDCKPSSQGLEKPAEQRAEQLEQSGQQCSQDLGCQAWRVELGTQCSGELPQARLQL